MKNREFFLDVIGDLGPSRPRGWNWTGHGDATAKEMTIGGPRMVPKLDRIRASSLRG